MSTDTAIRRVTVAEQAEQAARRFVLTGEREINPHEGTADAAAWSLAFFRWCSKLQAGDDADERTC